MLAPHLQHQVYRLENGLQVILHQDRRIPRVAVNLLYRVGSRDDPPDRAGLAHLLEHLMFMGTRKVGEGRFDQLLEQVGGWSNAFTSEDVTVYYEVGPTRLLETMLWLEADRMADVGRGLTAAKLRRQRDVVLNELGQEYENRPYGIAELEQPGMMYPPRHPYARPVIGSAQEIRTITVADVRRQIERCYGPQNASLVVAGDIDVDHSRRLVERYFGWIPTTPGGERSRRTCGRDPRRRRRVRRTYRDAVELPRLQLAWYSPAHLEPGDAEMDLVAEILAAGKRSRLHQQLVHEQRLGLSVDANQFSRPLGSVFEIGITVRRGVDRQQLEAEIRRLLQELLDHGLVAGELERVRRQFATWYLHGLQQVQRRAELLNAYAEALGTPDGTATDLRRYLRADEPSVLATARGVLGAPGCAVWVLPR